MCNKGCSLMVQERRGCEDEGSQLRGAAEEEEGEARWYEAPECMSWRWQAGDGNGEAHFGGSGSSGRACSGADLQGAMQGRGGVAEGQAADVYKLGVLLFEVRGVLGPMGCCRAGVTSQAQIWRSIYQVPTVVGDSPIANIVFPLL